jgi:hypothetical protein
MCRSYLYQCLKQNTTLVVTFSTTWMVVLRDFVEIYSEGYDKQTTNINGPVHLPSTKLPNHLTHPSKSGGPRSSYCAAPCSTVQDMGQSWPEKGPTSQRPEMQRRIGLGSHGLYGGASLPTLVDRWTSISCQQLADQQMDYILALERTLWEFRGVLRPATNRRYIRIVRASGRG